MSFSPLVLRFVTFSALSSLTTAGAAENAAAASGAAHGQAVFQQSCAVCHSNGTAGGGQGPTLAGVFGRRAAAAPNFTFTEALTKSGLTWDTASLDRFLANPVATVPGTSMVVPVANPQDRADVIAYLQTLKAPAAQSASALRGKPEMKPDAFDWHLDKPGAKHHITVASLPAPFSTSSAGNNPKVVKAPADAKLSVPDGFAVKLFAQGLNGPRLLRVAPNRDIFIAETRAKRVRVLRGADGADAPTADEIFAEGLDRPFGIAFYPLGDNPQFVYVAENNAIVRYPYRKGDLKATGAKEVIVAKLSQTTGGHSTRDIAFSNDGKRLFVSVGSASNVAEQMKKKNPQDVRTWEAEHGLGAAYDSEENRAIILVTDPDGKTALQTFATGIRNPVGLAVNPATGDLWTSTNERDGLGDNLVPDYITRVKERGYYGWPWYYLGNHEDPRLKGDRPDLAGKAIVPDVLLQAHSAALEIAFYPKATGPAAFPAEYQGNVFGALHGSWNRNSRTGYKVVRIRFENGVPTGEYEDFLTGFVVDQTSVWGRPVGVTVAHDGALLVTDDEGGTLWRIAPVAH